jgi:hypothetical protein
MHRLTLPPITDTASGIPRDGEGGGGVPAGSAKWPDADNVRRLVGEARAQGVKPGRPPGAGG